MERIRQIGDRQEKLLGLVDKKLLEKSQKRERYEFQIAKGLSACEKAGEFERFKHRVTEAYKRVDDYQDMLANVNRQMEKLNHIKHVLSLSGYFKQRAMVLTETELSQTEQYVAKCLAEIGRM
jgi:hypothetical protein